MVLFVQMSEEVTQGTSAMNLILTYKEKLSKNLKVEGNLGGKSKKLSEFSIAKSSATRTVKLNRFRELVGWIFWQELLREKEVQENWQLLKQTILKNTKAKESTIEEKDLA